MRHITVPTWILEIVFVQEVDMCVHVCAGLHLENMSKPKYLKWDIKNLCLSLILDLYRNINNTSQWQPCFQGAIMSPFSL